MGAKILPGFCFVLLFFDRSTVLVVCLGILSTSFIFWFFLMLFQIFFSCRKYFFWRGILKQKQKFHMRCTFTVFYQQQWIHSKLDLLERVALQCAVLKRKQRSENPPPLLEKLKVFFLFLINIAMLPKNNTPFRQKKNILRIPAYI